MAGAVSATFQRALNRAFQLLTSGGKRITREPVAGVNADGGLTMGGAATGPTLRTSGTARGVRAGTPVPVLWSHGPGRSIVPVAVLWHQMSRGTIPAGAILAPPPPQLLGLEELLVLPLDPDVPSSPTDVWFRDARVFDRLRVRERLTATVIISEVVWGERDNTFVVRSVDTETQKVRFDVFQLNRVAGEGFTLGGLPAATLARSFTDWTIPIPASVGPVHEGSQSSSVSDTINTYYSTNELPIGSWHFAGTTTAAYSSTGSVGGPGLGATFTPQPSSGTILATILTASLDVLVLAEVQVDVGYNYTDPTVPQIIAHGSGAGPYYQPVEFGADMSFSSEAATAFYAPHGGLFPGTFVVSTQYILGAPISVLGRHEGGPDSVSRIVEPVRLLLNISHNSIEWSGPQVHRSFSSAATRVDSQNVPRLTTGAIPAPFDYARVHTISGSDSSAATGVQIWPVKVYHIDQVHPERARMLVERRMPDGEGAFPPMKTFYEVRDTAGTLVQALPDFPTFAQEDPETVGTISKVFVPLTGGRRFWLYIVQDWLMVEEQYRVLQSLQLWLSDYRERNLLVDVGTEADQPNQDPIWQAIATHRLEIITGTIPDALGNLSDALYTLQESRLPTKPARIAEMATEQMHLSINEWDAYGQLTLRMFSIVGDDVQLPVKRAFPLADPTAALYVTNPDALAVQVANLLGTPDAWMRGLAHPLITAHLVGPDQPVSG